MSCLFSVSAQAQTYTWGSTGSTTTTADYNLGTNWSNPPASAPPVTAGKTAIFDATGSATVTITAGPITPDSWTFSTTSQNYTVSGQAVNFNGAAPNLVNSGGTNSISNNLTGAGVLVTGGTLTLTGTNSFTTTVISGGTLKAGSANAVGSGSNVTVGTSGTAATLDLNGQNLVIGTLAGNTSGIVTNTGISAAQVETGSGGNSTFAGTIQDGASTTALRIAGNTLTLSRNNTYTGMTTIAAGTLALSGSGSIAASAQVTISGASGTFDISGTSSGASIVSLGGTGTVTLGSKTLTLTNTASDYEGAINGSGALTVFGGVQVLGGNNGYTGITTINSGAAIDIVNSGSIASSVKVVDNGDFNIFGTTTGASIKSLAGSNSAATVTLGSKTLTIVNANDSFAGNIRNTGNLVLSSGTETLTGANSYTGTTTVNGGLLRVDGSIASSSMTTVNSGGNLAGLGTVGNVTVNGGGFFAPGQGTVGGVTTVSGSLVLASAAVYYIEVTPAAATSSTVSGNANLGGAFVGAQFAAGSYVAKQYTILTADSITGTFNSGVLTGGAVPAGFSASLSYDPKHAYLNLALNFAPPSGSLNGNQQNVGNAIINFFNTTGGIPMAFGGLTPAGLAQLSGEVGSAPQQTTLNAMTQFLGVMTDPFIAGRGDPISAGGVPNTYTDERMAYAASGKGRSASTRDAFAAYTKAPAAPAFEQRWSVWAAGFGGAQQTDGSTAVGSNTTTSNLYGTAVGADYRLSRDTLLGFSLAGGGANFSVAGNLGGGRSDLFQAGAFFRHNAGPAYITGALAYGWQDITTDRTVTVAGFDRLRAEFNANAYSSRLEGGYRFMSQGISLTPYAAAQVTAFELPAYAEQAVAGGNQFALAYSAQSLIDTRSELGLRTDKAFGQTDGVVTLRSRVAWAHDFNPNRAIGATFQTLPGASFVVNGAAMASDSALITASADKNWLNGWAAAATFEGEFSSVTRSYAGKGVVRYAW